MLLDTCALLWLTQGGGGLSRATLGRIEQAPVLYVSAISGFEVGLKYRGAKLKLPVPPAQWFAGVVEHHDLAVLELSLAVCLRATELPPIHRDPCDRFIIATALELGLPVVTADQHFSSYGVEVLA